MNRRLVALLVVLAISLQGPSLAYAAAAAAKTMPASCAHHILGQSGGDDSCCPQGMLPGVCCAGGLVLTSMASAPVTLPAVPLHLVPSPSASTPFATERPSPLLRPPIA